MVILECSCVDSIQALRAWPDQQQGARWSVTVNIETRARKQTYCTSLARYIQRCGTWKAPGNRHHTPVVYVHVFSLMAPPRHHANPYASYRLSVCIFSRAGSRFTFNYESRLLIGAVPTIFSWRRSSIYLIAVEMWIIYYFVLYLPGKSLF